MKGSELDTRFGHFLVYGVTENLARDIDFGDVRMDSRELVKAARHHGAIAVPAHPGRAGIGLANYIEQGETFDGLNIVEKLNGGSVQAKTNWPKTCATAAATWESAAATPI